MKIDFTQPVCDLNGKPFQDQGEPTTLGIVAIAALLQNYPDEAGKLPGEEKYARYSLATKVKDKAADVTVEEIAKLKQLIGRFFGPSVVGPAYDMLEGRITPPAELPTKSPSKKSS